MFGIGGTEIILIAALGLLLFGPDKLPQIARSIGRFTAELKRYQAMMESVLKAEMYAAEAEAARRDRDKGDPLKAAQEYREKAGTTIPGQEPGTRPDAGEAGPASQGSAGDEGGAIEPVDETIDPDFIVPELAHMVWTPGGDNAPPVEMDEGERDREEGTAGV